MRRRSRPLPVAALVLGCFAAPVNARAQLLEGAIVQVWDFHGTAPDRTALIGPVERVVGSAVELRGFGWAGFMDIDLADTSIVITAADDQPFGYFESVRFVDVDRTIPDFIGVSVNPTTDWNGFDASRVSVSADVIQLELTRLGGQREQRISLEIHGCGQNCPGGIFSDGFEAAAAR